MVSCALVLGFLLICSQGPRPLSSQLTDYIAHASGSSCSGALPSGTIIGMAATRDDGGYWIANNQGLVVACGDATNFGGLTSAPNAPIVGIAATPDGGGYYLVASDGGIFTFGDAAFQGSAGNMRLTRPVVGMAVDPVTGGYWLVASDGGVFSFNAPFYGSTGSMRLNRPIVGMASDINTGGYWLVASDGGIFAFTAPFEGSMGSVTLNKPIVGMAPDAAGGYWLVAADGGIFSFDGAPFHGSTGSMVLSRPIVGMEAGGTGTGYRFVASDGGVFDFGSSSFFGSAIPSATTPASTPTTTAPQPTTTTTQPPSTTTTTTTGPTSPLPTTTVPQPQGTLAVTLFDGLVANCQPPFTTGCLQYVTISGSGWVPNQTYDLSVAGPNLSDITETVTTDNEGDIDFGPNPIWGAPPTGTVAETSSPPTPGTYSVSMGGVTASYAYDPAPAIDVGMIATSGCVTDVCSFNVDFLATGFPIDQTLPVTVTWDGNVIGQSMTATDDTGSIWATSGYTTPPEQFLAIVGSPQGTVSVTVGDLTVTESV
jgi:hypothetical protein